MGILGRIKKNIDVALWKRKKGKGDRTTGDLEIPVVFRVGSVGEIRGEEFEDIGQARYDWGGGMWDECLLEFKGKRKWLLIDEPKFILFDEEIPLAEVFVNKGWNLINNRKIFIESIRKATITNAGGYAEVKEGTDVRCYDGYDENKNFISVRQYLGKYSRNSVLRVGRELSRFEMEVYG